MEPVPVGVAQGSTLGPLMFLVFINDIINCSNLLKFNLFADDTSLYFGNNNPINVSNTFNSQLKNIYNWINANKICLNADKYTFMLLSSVNNPSNYPDLFIK